MASESSCDNTQFWALLPLINKIALSTSDLRKAGYTKTQMLILTTLFRRDSLTMGGAAGFICSSKEQATRAVAPLVDSGLVERYVDPKNRTKIHIRLTETGRAAMEQNNKNFVHNLYQLFRERISDEEIMELKNAVETIIRILSKVEDV